MNEEQFKKGIEDLKSIHLTDAEKARILKSVFATPIRSPFMRRIPVFAYVYSLLLIISISGVTYTSASSLPGDVLYPIKTGVVESVLDVVNRAPEDRIVWEEEKVERRIVEAEVLAKQGRLDDKKLEGLERSIEKSSRAFVKAVEEKNGDEQGDRKEEFRKKVNERKGAFEKNENENESESEIERSDKKEIINRLKSTAIKVLDDEDKNEDEGVDIRFQ